ncbi:amidohydrolase [Streptomyces inhibens]|uniref:Amidohydrolase n=1 Tax=Streptomyces inhibens TaxID=2293571 RepID=A0A371Q207_STRIH|nr:amidohydrolase family protein [Streptomyces inhibens]REK88742.1 amidohydrolase [Streptomyces inhibens]
MRTDVHAHLWSERYLRLLESYGRPDAAAHRGLGAGDSPRELDARFTMNDAAGIDHQILFVSPQGPYFADAGRAVTAARHANDHYAGLVRDRPTRFSAFAALPLPHLDQSLTELARALDELGMVGVGVTTDVLGRSLADPAFTALFEELDRRGGVLSLHPSGHDAGSPLIAAHRMRWMVGAPTEDTICAIHLILEGIPRRFPRLRIIHAHLGGALPMLLPRADDHLPWEAPDVVEKPTEAARRMWYDTVAHGHVPAVRAAADSYGADRLMLGTDFPYQSGQRLRRAVSFIEEALPPEQADEVLTAGSGLIRRIAA